MTPQNLHAHSTLDDGRNTLEEMVRASVAAGMSSCGLSLHSPLPFASDWAPEAKTVETFLQEMRRLKEAYAPRAAVYAGIEWDVLSTDVDLAPFDYVIGSAHHLPVGGARPTVDESPEATADLLARHFDGDADAAAALYFSELEKVAAEPRAQVVGHFDLLTKFNQRGAFFDESSPAYRRAAAHAMEALVASGKIFEVNTGAISRGYRTTPYPSRTLLEQLRRMGGRVTLGSDAHSAGSVACAFDEALALLRGCGFTQLWQLVSPGAFQPVPLDAF